MFLKISFVFLWATADLFFQSSLPQAVRDRDPACTCLPDVFLYFKGFHALQTYRVAHAIWKADNKQVLAHYLQSQMSQTFQIDIHPNATLGTYCSAERTLFSLFALKPRAKLSPVPHLFHRNLKCLWYFHLILGSGIMLDHGTGKYHASNLMSSPTLGSLFF